MESIILIEGIFAVIYLFMKKAAICIWERDKERFIFMRYWYHWFEFIYVFIAAVLAPKHTINEGIVTLTVVIIIKIIFDKTKIFDRYFNRTLS